MEERLARLFRYLERFPEAVREEDPATPEGGGGEEADEDEGRSRGLEGDAAGRPRPTALGYRRVALDDRSGPQS